MKQFERLSIVIPFYNEEQFIPQILAKVIAAKTLSLDKEIILINDGSTDSSEKIVEQEIKNLKSKKIDFLFINNHTNRGKGEALKQGFLQSTGDVVLVQDADLEYNPNDYELLLEPFFQSEADVVYGSRFISNRPHRVLYFWHYVANTILTTLSNIFTNLNLTDMETGYKAFRGSIIRKIAPHLQSKRFGFEPEITARLAKIPHIKIYEVGISYAGRTYSEGKKIGWKDGFKAVRDILLYNLFK